MTLEPLRGFDGAAAAPSVRRAAAEVDAARGGLVAAGQVIWDSPTAAQAYRSALAEVQVSLFIAQTRLDIALAAVSAHDHAVAAERSARAHASGAAFGTGLGLGFGTAAGALLGPSFGAWPGPGLGGLG